MKQLVLDKVYLHPVRLEVIHDCMYDGIAHHCTKKPRRCVEWCANEDAPIQGVTEKCCDIVVLVLVGDFATAYLLPSAFLLAISQPTLQGIVGDKMSEQHQNQNGLHTQHRKSPSMQQVTIGAPSHLLGPQGQSPLLG
jgi:hypothetical protein